MTASLKPLGMNFLTVRQRNGLLNMRDIARQIGISFLGFFLVGAGGGGGGG